MNSNEATSEQDPSSKTECNDHFYAVVDKSKKKRMAPEVGTFNYPNQFLLIANDHMFNITLFKDARGIFTPFIMFNDSFIESVMKTIGLPCYMVLWH